MSIPLVRAAALAPIMRWMQDHERDTQALLDEIDLGWLSRDNTLDPIPLRQACIALCRAAQQEGENLPWRAVGDKGFLELGLLASIGLQAATPRQIMGLVQVGMHAHCTHETFNISATKNGDLIVEDGWMTPFDDAEQLHLVQQYCTAMVDMICKLTFCSEPVLRHVNMVPHPRTGFTHLNDTLGDRVSSNGTKVLRIVIPQDVADSRIHLDGIEVAKLPTAADFVPLRQGNSIAYPVSLLIRGMLRSGPVDIDRICSAVGTTRRSLQRGLSLEGTTFSEVLDLTRRHMAKEMMRDEGCSLSAVAASLGYKNQSAFSRAFQRWEGKSARQVKKVLTSEKA